MWVHFTGLFILLSALPFLTLYMPALSFSFFLEKKESKTWAMRSVF